MLSPRTVSWSRSWLNFFELADAIVPEDLRRFLSLGWLFSLHGGGGSLVLVRADLILRNCTKTRVRRMYALAFASQASEIEGRGSSNLRVAVARPAGDRV